MKKLKSKTKSKLKSKSKPEKKVKKLSKSSLRSRRKNPENPAYILGYETGKEDISKGSWNLENIDETYKSKINEKLRDKSYKSAFVDYRSFLLGYMKSMIDVLNDFGDKVPADKKEALTKYYEEKLAKKDFFSPILEDHTYVIKLIGSGYDKLKSKDFKYSLGWRGFAKQKLPSEAINSISAKLNDNEFYAAFILKNLGLLRYIDQNFLGNYTLTDKGKRIFSEIGSRHKEFLTDKNRLVPEQYRLISDIEMYLS